jgi:uncharacterized membrane protein (UPF0127 family)
MTRALVLVCGLLLSGPALAETCALDRADLRGPWGQLSVTVSVADTVPERAQGLMNVPAMPRLTGMLFVYEDPQRVSFWMRNTLIPLDMLFMDASGTVTRIHENAIPLDETPIPGGGNVSAVLEVNGGLSADLGITEGTQLRHPAMPQDAAAWPCAAD